MRGHGSSQASWLSDAADEPIARARRGSAPRNRVVPYRSARSREVRSACGPESRDSDLGSDFGSGARAGGGAERSCGRLAGSGAERSCGRLTGAELGASRTGAGGGAATGAGGRYRS